MPVPSTMKAVVLHGADDMRVRDWPTPEPGPGEVLLKVAVAWYAGPVEMDMNLAVRSNVRIYAARGEGGMNCGRSLALMSAGQLVSDSIITHHFPLDRIQDAFDTYVSRAGNALKVAIHV